MGYRNIINELQKIDYSKYKNISSHEKLMLYVALVLERNNIPLTFNYLCIATFKIFPDTFCCDEEFKEFPSVDRLNRTYMHLKYVQKGMSYITGSTKEGYSLTKLGRSFAQETEAIIYNTKIDETIKAPIIDSHKKGFSKDYSFFISGDGYKKHIETGKIDIMYIWEYYKVTPYTQIKKIKNNLNDVLTYAKEMTNNECVDYIEKILKMI